MLSADDPQYVADAAPIPEAFLARLIRGSARYTCSAMALICFGLFLFHPFILWVEWPSEMSLAFAYLGMAFTLMALVFTDQLRKRAGWRLVPLVLALLLALFLLASRHQGT